jgi:hypothetical protein
LPTANVPAQLAAWNKTGTAFTEKRPYHFPVYYQWNFRTGITGDFESLAAALKNIVIDDKMSSMPMDISDPGFGLAAAPEGLKTIDLEVALAPVEHKVADWPREDETQENGVNAADLQVITKLRDVLNYSADLAQNRSLVQTYANPYFNSNLGDDPILVPPVYGVWHSMIDRLGHPDNPVWVEQLNLDFRYRAAAGLGATVVQKNQETFMHRAWEQINTVNEANRKIEEGLLAGMINQSLARKHIMTAGNDIAIQMTGAMQHIVKDGAVTLQKSLNDSRVPNGVKSAAFRKITRPRNPLNNMLNKKSAQALATGTQTVLDRRNVMQHFNAERNSAGALRAANLKGAPGSALDSTKITSAATAASTYFKADFKNIQKQLLILAIRDTVRAKGQATQADLSKYIYAYNDSTLSLDDKDKIEGNLAKLSPYPLVPLNGDIIVTVEDITFRVLFDEGANAKRYENVILKNSAPLDPEQIKPITLKMQMDDLMGAVLDFGTRMGDVAATVKEAGVLLNAGNAGQRILDQLNPVEVMARKLAATITVNGVKLNSLKPVMAYPTFNEPVYEYLLALSRDYILPNIDKIPNNSMALIRSNQSFVEAFLAGMNHEMARELLWREYPTDQRGSYFRQFWGTQDNIPMTPETPYSAEGKKDIHPMELWTAALGGNRPISADGFLVLVIRGELLRKYPNTMIYAQRAKFNSTTPWYARDLTQQMSANDTKFPLFKADIGDDITLLGFDLALADALGKRVPQGVTDTAGYNPGWFFMLKERPGQVRFGIDDWIGTDNNPMPPPGPLDTWNQLCWEHLVTNAKDLGNYNISFNNSVAIKQPLDQPAWNSNAADLAAILFQDPVLYARHASEMLAEETQENQ